MKASKNSVRIMWFLLFLQVSVSERMEWSGSNFPNPTAGDFRRCNMRTTSNICDPDQVLSELQRYRLNHDLHQLEAHTRQEHGHDFCQKKGVTAAMAVVRHLRGGTEEAAKEMANSILHNWSLDQQCQKSVVIVLATEDRRFWVARAAKVPVFANEFTQIFNNQKYLFSAGEYDHGLSNILKQISEKALSKQTSPNNGERALEPAPPPYFEGKGRIPLWTWLVPLLLLPLLCCFCTCYFCCRRRSDYSTAEYRTTGQGDVENDDLKGTSSSEPPGKNNGGLKLLNGLIGTGLSSAAGRFINDRLVRNRRDNRTSGQADAVGQPKNIGHTISTISEEKVTAVYPDTEAHDEGGGGTWK